MTNYSPQKQTALFPRVTPPHILSELQAIRRKLIEDGLLESESYSADHLALLLVRVEDLQCSHDAKVPWSLMNDFSPGGGAQILLETIFVYAKTHKWNSLDLNEDNFPDVLQSLLNAIEPIRTHPRIYLSPTISPDSVDKCQTIVARLRGQIVDFSQATHIVDTGRPVDDRNCKDRIVTVSPTHALLHRFKQPRRQRRWVPLRQVPDGIVDDTADPAWQGGGPIRVAVDWIEMSSRYGEWLDEMDFLLSDHDPSVIRLTRKNGFFAFHGLSGPIATASPEATYGSRKRRSSTDKQQHAKKLRVLSPQFSATEASERPLPSLDEESSLNHNVTLGQPSRTHYESIADVLPYKGPVMTSVAPLVREGRSQFPVVLPCYSTWFSFDAVHANEKKSLHELFSGDDAEDVYISQRNFMVHAFRSNPRVHLSATACRKMIAGDAISLMRIHNFLEQWGIINYHVDPGTIPEYSGPGSPSFNTTPVFVHSPWAGVQSADQDNTNGIFPDWSEAEIESMLQAVLVHGENWTAVAETLGNGKSSAEIIEQFARLPLSRCEHRERSTELVQSSNLLPHSSSDLLLPFKDSAHPILTQVAMLASAVNPEAMMTPESSPSAYSNTSSTEDMMQTEDEGIDSNLHVGLAVRVDQFGTGIIAQSIRSDNFVCVKLPFGFIYTPVEKVTPLYDEQLPAPKSSVEVSLHDLTQSFLRSAALRSKHISSTESRTIMALVSELVETQMKKIEIKLKQFDEVQVVLSRQRELIEQSRQEVFAERIELAHARMKLTHSQSSAPMDSAVSPTST